MQPTCWETRSVCPPTAKRCVRRLSRNAVFPVHLFPTHSPIALFESRSHDREIYSVAQNTLISPIMSSFSLLVSIRSSFVS